MAITSSYTPVKERVDKKTIHTIDPFGSVGVSATDNRSYPLPIPLLDGTLITDAATLALIFDDFGSPIQPTPIAVLRPGSINDVVKVVRFAKKQHVRITSRGRGNALFGQSLVKAGMVVDISSLHQIHRIAADHAVVDAGVSWFDLLLATTAVGLTPPLLTSYMNCAVGDTFSATGEGGQRYQHGAQTNPVLELRVVMGDGELITCSASENKDLFDTVLAGLDPYAIIVRATVRLMPAKERAITLRLFYPDAPSMRDDLQLLIREGRFNYIWGNSLLPPGQSENRDFTGTVDTPEPDVFFIEATAFYTSLAEVPVNPLDGLHFIFGQEEFDDRTYLDFINTVTRHGVDSKRVSVHTPTGQQLTEKTQA